MQQEQTNESNRLNSWKEIGAYLERDARTAQRWEKEEGLPVHRHSHKARSSVYAYPSEIDAWRAGRKVVPEPVARPLWLRPAFVLTLALCLVMVGNGIRPQAASAQAGNGMSTRRVWEPPNINAGYVSPDGRYLPYLDWQHGGLAMRDLVSGQSRVLIQGSWDRPFGFSDGQPVLSPDGKLIAYTWFTSESRYHLRVLAMDAAGQAGAARVIFDNADTEYSTPKAWTSDGRHILASIKSKDRTWRLSLLPVAGGPERVIKSTAWSEPGSARISPDGRYIAYDLQPKEDSPDHDIFVLAIDGSHQETIVQHPANDAFVDWTPDGSALVFQSTRTGTWGLWTIAVQDGRAAGPPTLIKREMGRVDSSGLSRSGALYYLAFVDREDVFVAGIDLERAEVTGKPAPVNPLAVGGRAVPAWSPDGDRLASLYWGNIVIRAERSGEERLIRPALEIPSNRRSLQWSPDGRSLLVTGPDAKSRHGLYQIDVESGAVAEVVQTEDEFPVGVYSSDGQAVIYSQARRGISLRDLKTGRERQIAPWAGSDTRQLGLALSPDGKWLAIAARRTPEQETVLELVPMGGGETKILHQQPGTFAGLQWTPDGRHLLYRSGADLYRIPAAGGEPHALAVKVFNSGRGHFSVHPDGRRIAYVAGQNKAEFWVMENFLPKTGGER